MYLPMKYENDFLSMMSKIGFRKICLIFYYPRPNIFGKKELSSLLQTTANEKRDGKYIHVNYISTKGGRNRVAK